MNNVKYEFINLIMNKNGTISADKNEIFKELIIKYLLNQIKGEKLE